MQESLFLSVKPPIHRHICLLPLQVLTGILDLLHPTDSFSITLFSDSACTPKAFGPVSCVDIPSLKAQVGCSSARWQQLSCVGCHAAPAWLLQQPHLEKDSLLASHLSMLETAACPICCICLQILKDVNDTSSTALSAGWDQGGLPLVAFDGQPLIAPFRRGLDLPGPANSMTLKVAGRGQSSESALPCSHASCLTPTVSPCLQPPPS